MINKINGLDNVKMYSAPAFKAEENTVSKPVEEKEYDAKPLANYAKASIDLKKKLKVEPLIPTIYLPEAIDAIKGERIYKSNGDLYAIVDENEKTRTVFNPTKDDNNMFDSIITTDKKTGKIIREQHNYIEDNKLKEICIHEFSPETGKETAYTSYVDGKLDYASKTTYNKYGIRTDIGYDYNNKEYRIFESSKDDRFRKDIIMTEDMKFVTVNTTVEKNTKQIFSRAEFYNGALLNTEKSTTTVMPNMMGLNPFNDEDLIPDEVLSKEDLQNIADSIDGEKTYFSNGAIESVKGMFNELDTTVNFKPNGDVEEVITDKYSYSVGDYSIIYKNNIDENNKKITDVFYNGGKSVTFEKDGNFKEVYYSEDEIITSYYEGEIEDNGEKDYELCLHYDKNGMLRDAYNS